MNRLLSALLAVCLLTSSVWANSRTFGGVSTDKVSVAQHAAINDLTTLTLSVWSYRTGAGGGSNGRMVNKNDNGGLVGSFNLFNADAASTYAFQATRWNSNLGQWSFPRPSADAWHHVAVTYDYGSTTNNPLMYLDGVSQTVTEDAGGTPAGTVQAETSVFDIGNRADNARNWAGQVAHVALWNVILTAAEAAQLAAGVSPLRVRPASLVLYLPLDGLASPEPNRATGRAANTGTVTGTVAATPGPRVRPLHNQRPVMVP